MKAWLFMVLLTASMVHAEEQAEVDLFSRIPVMPGTRAAAVAGAFTAVADDYTALYYNPAGLAHMKRMEFSMSARWTNQCNEAGFSGYSTTETCESAASLDHLGVALPFPVYRGGVTLAIGYQRLQDFSQPYEASQSPVTFQVVEKGGIGSWSFGMGFQMSRHFSGGVSVDLLRGDETYDFQMQTPEYILRDYSDLSITGTRLTLGGRFQMTRQLVFGMTVRTPVNYRFAWNEFRQDTLHQDGSPDDSYSVNYDKYTFQHPAEIICGLAWQNTYLTLTADIHWVDWQSARFSDYSDSQFAKENQVIRDSYSAVTGVRVGAAFGLPTSDLMLRTGAALYPRAGDVNADQPRMLLAAGFSWLVDEVIELNAAVQYRQNQFQYSGPEPLLEENRTDLNLLSGFYYHF